jgi:predicted XRE-type DNA-binding protein
MNNVEPIAPHLTQGDVLKDIGLGSAEVREARLKAFIYDELMKRVDARKLTAAKLAVELPCSREEAADLTHGKVSKFSLNVLLRYLIKMCGSPGAAVECLLPFSEPMNPEQRERVVSEAMKVIKRRREARQGKNVLRFPAHSTENAE